jgi:integrase/recombinase XerD
MATHNADNERIKRKYLAFLKQAKGQSEDSVDAVAKALARFEAATRYRDFKAFHFEQAVAFKRHLAEQNSRTTGGKLSKATLHATLGHLKRFFQWLADKPGYKSLHYSNAEYFNLSDKDTRVATARRHRPAPTLEQVKHAIALMPCGSDIERRDRALVAFTLMTGARDSALASMKLKHVDLAAGSVFQDAREVQTKFSKSFTTYFFNVGSDVRQIFDDWVNYLRQVKLWGNDDPLFPATLVELGETQQFAAVGLSRRHWSTASPIRAIFKGAFEAAGLPYFNPHSFRTTLVQLGQTMCKDPEAFKAWSQNLGHEGVLTTFLSYGAVAPGRQGQIIQTLAIEAAQPHGQAEVVAQAVLQAMRGAGLLGGQR